MTKWVSFTMWCYTCNKFTKHLVEGREITCPKCKNMRLGAKLDDKEFIGKEDNEKRN